MLKVDVRKSRMNFAENNAGERMEGYERRDLEVRLMNVAEVVVQLVS